MGTTDGFMCERCYNRKSILCTRKDCPQVVTASDLLEQLAEPFGTAYNIVKEMELKLSKQQAAIAEMSELLYLCKEELKTWNAVFTQQHGGIGRTTEKLIKKINKTRGNIGVDDE